MLRTMAEKDILQAKWGFWNPCMTYSRSRSSTDNHQSRHVYVLYESYCKIIARMKDLLWESWCEMLPVNTFLVVFRIWTLILFRLILKIMFCPHNLIVKNVLLWWYIAIDKTCMSSFKASQICYICVYMIMLLIKCFYFY